MSEGHLPVLLEETLGMLSRGSLAGASPLALDCTFGGGGHSGEILRRFPSCRLTAIDTDPEAAPRAAALAAEFPGRVSFIDSNFGELANLPVGTGYGAVLFDLGVSSYHFDTAGRGFSFRADAPLDMRMNPREGQSAAEFLETASDYDLCKALRDYAEEPRWKAVARAIVAARGTGRLSRTLSFAELVAQAVGGRMPQRIHPATKTFQGVRIFVNREMESLESALPAAFEILAPKGVLAVISFHSLEDRIVKRFFRRMAGLPETREDNTPQQSRVRRAELLENKPVTASTDEEAGNPRARSAKLRALCKL
ncbi:MAG TPA: 16S rRNA (cytosine(1402)-N(4))-methyltransferase RsmH [Opitutales bacterium]|nr:16S rRNA (cytosine(1402)-N(4))-methyltransferase RsmH [Opitutales bacterium]